MSILLAVLVIILFCVGLFGTIIPAVPGVGLVYAGVLLYAVATGFSSIGVSTLVAMGIVALLASAASYTGSVVGAKKGGGGTRSLWGAILGAVMGVVVMPPAGLFLGAFVGALVGALLEGHTPEKAAKVAFMSVIGIVGGTLVQFVLSLLLILAFFLALVF